MLDIRRLLYGLTQTIGRADFPDAAALAAALNVDLSHARVTKTKKGNLAIQDAHLNDGGLTLDIACGVAPPHDIWLLIKDSALPYRNIKDEIFGADQRIQGSKFSTGFGVIFEIDGWTCGFTAPSPEGDVDSLFCQESKPAFPS